ncbi:MAG: SDR family NAD(P)-dependent oxidoreductase [Candidatus Tectimicrobiota bacterium]
MRLQGKTALITGASRNIGRTIALAFAREGANLVLNTRTNHDELKAVAAECESLGVRVLPALADVSEAAQVTQMVTQGLDSFGAIDILVSNAAIRPHKSIVDTTLEEWQQVLAVDLSAAFYLCKALAPSMIERRTGSLIAIGGLSSLTGRPNTAAVTAAKTGLLGLIRALAAELAPYNVRANMVMPGFMDTERRYPEWYPEFRDHPRGSSEQVRSIPMGRQGRPEEVAQACVFLASDESSYVTGDRILCMGGRFIG